MKHLVVRWRDGHTNLPITRIEHIGDVVYAYQDKELVGFFDLGSVDALYVSEDRATYRQGGLITRGCNV